MYLIVRAKEGVSSRVEGCSNAGKGYVEAIELLSSCTFQSDTKVQGESDDSLL